MNSKNRIRCSFSTSRMQVSNADIKSMSKEEKLLFTRTVLNMLTPEVTKTLPDGWQNVDSLSAAAGWIEARSEESCFLKVDLLSDSKTIGLIFLHESSENCYIKLHLGYLLSGNVWGQGYATELISGLTEWCRKRGDISSLTGGVEKSNTASIKVLEKSGFIQIASPVDDVLFYELKLSDSLN